MFDVIILAGGFGTRLASVLPNLPKALAPIGKTPFIDLMLQRLAQEQIANKAVLALGFKSELIIEHFKNSPPVLPVEFSIETSPLGTGGALLLALQKTKSETVLVMNGDCFCNLSFTGFSSFHLEKKADLTLAVLYSQDLSRYGSVLFEQDGRISHFQEKTQDRNIGYLSMGAYLIQRSALAEFPEGACSIETDLFPQLLSKRAFAFKHLGEFLDIGTPQSYELAQTFFSTFLHYFAK